MSFPFNVRVYGALIHERHILLSSESYKGKSLTKLPGGGLEFGEGLPDALIREFMEEMSVEIEVLGHIYTTDFFQRSAFNPADQVISVYYRVDFVQVPVALPEMTPNEEGQTFFWKPLSDLVPSDFTMPIDRHIVPVLRGIL